MTSQTKWRTKKLGAVETVPGWWWCRRRSHPDCEIMVKVNYRHAPWPRSCRVCDRDYNLEYMRRVAQRYRPVSKPVAKCTCCGKRPVYKSPRKGIEQRLLCRECYLHDGCDYGIGNSYLSRLDFERAEQLIAAARDDLSKKVKVYRAEDYSQEELLELAGRR